MFPTLLIYYASSLKPWLCGSVTLHNKDPWPPKLNNHYSWTGWPLLCGTYYQFNCNTDALHQVSIHHSKHTRLYQSPKKLHHTTTVIPPHHEDFCWHCWITSSMAKTVTTPGLLQLPSSQHCLRSYCCLVWSDLPYFRRNCTISTVQILLHGSHQDWKKGWWEFSECTLFYGDL